MLNQTETSLYTNTVYWGKGQVEMLDKEHGKLVAAEITRKYLNSEPLLPEEKEADFTCFQLVLKENKLNFECDNQNQKTAALILFKLGMLQGLKDIWDGESTGDEEREELKWIPSFISLHTNDLAKQWPSNLNTTVFEKLQQIPKLAMIIAIFLAAISFLGIIILIATNDNLDIKPLKEFALLILAGLVLKGFMLSTLFIGCETAVIKIGESLKRERFEGGFEKVNKARQNAEKLLKDEIKVYSLNAAQTIFGSSAESAAIGKTPDSSLTETTDIGKAPDNSSTIINRPGFSVSEM